MESLEQSADIAQWCTVTHNGEGGYETDQGDHTYVVKLNQKTCTCRRYTLSGIPCAHAVCAIRDRRDNPIDYVSSWLSKEMYLKAYEKSIQPIIGMKDWPNDEDKQIRPPHYKKKGLGRPKKARRKNPNEPEKPKK